MFIKNPDGFTNTNFTSSLTGIPFNNTTVDYCSFGKWEKEDVYFDPKNLRSVTEEVTYWSKCLNASTYNFTHDIDNIYPNLGSQYKKNDLNNWILPLEQGPGIGQKGHFIPDRALTETNTIFLEVQYISYYENINIGSIITKITIDSSLLSPGDTILLMNQTDIKENGLYTVSNQYKLVPTQLSIDTPTIVIALKGRYNIGKQFITIVDSNNNVITPYQFEPTDRWLIRSRTEYKTKRTFTFRHGLPHYGIVIGDNGLILDINIPETKLVDTRWALYYSIEDDNGLLWVCGNRGTILQSSDLGQTWTNVFIETEAGFRWMGTIGDYVIIIGERATVYYTTDSGKTFVQVFIPRRYTKDLLYGYVTISEKTGNPILWAIGEEGVFLEIDIVLQTTLFHKLESELRNEATLGQLQIFFPLGDGFIILGNDIVGYWNITTSTWCDLYPLDLGDPLVNKGEVGGRNWAGYEIIATGSQQDIIYLFSQKGEIFSLTLNWDSYTRNSCPLSQFELLKNLDIENSILHSVLVSENGWLAVGSRRGLWTIDFTTLELTEISGIDPLFKNRFLILDYFMARKMETVVNNEDIVPTGKIPVDNINDISYFELSGPVGKSNYFNWYQSFNPEINNSFVSMTGISDYSITGLTTVVSSILHNPANTLLAGPAGLGIDYFNLTGMTGIEKFVTGSYATIFIDWVNGLSVDESLVSDINIISNVGGIIGIPTIIDEKPQLDTYPTNVQLWLNPFGLYNNNNFYLNLNSFGYTGPSSIIADMNTGDYIIIDVITNNNIILNHGFVLKSKTSFGGGDFLIFEENLTEDMITNLNESLHFNRSVLNITNGNRFSSDNTLDIVLSNHPIGSAYSLDPDTLFLSGKMTYLTSYFNLECISNTIDNLSVNSITNIDYSTTDTTWNPGYTLINFLSSLSNEITPDIIIKDLYLNVNNLVLIPSAVSYDNRILVTSNYDKNIESVFNKLDSQNQWVDLTINETGIVYPVLIKQMKFLEDQNWLMILDSPIGIDFNSSITLKGRCTLGQISEDLEATDDIHFKLQRKSSYSSKARLGGIATALLNNTIIKSLLTAVIYVDDTSNVVINTLDISDDPNWAYRPVDLFQLGSDNGCRTAIWISNANFSQTNPNWKREISSGISPSASLVNVNIERVRYRLIDSLTLQSVHDRYNWILNAHIDNALIGQDFSNNSIVWYLGDWYCGYFEGGRWCSGDWYGGIWNAGIWESLVVEDLFNAARILEDLTDGNASNWWDGTWKGGVFDGGTWWGGLWKDGDFIFGLWQSGRWKTGTWYNGDWRGGTWYAGTFKNGNMNGRNYRTVWKNGLWTGGDFENGTWEYGTWESSPSTPSRFGIDVNQFHRAVWLDGVWKDGQFMARVRDHKRKNYKSVWRWSTWVAGTWMNGHFKGGEFQSGEFQNGYWMDGMFGSGVTDTISALWINGHWKTGIWVNGTWMNGTMEKSLWMNGEFLSGKHGLQIKRTRKLRIRKNKYLPAATTNKQNRNVKSSSPNPLTQLEESPKPIKAFDGSYTWP